MHIPDKDETKEVSIKPKEADEILDEQIRTSLIEHKRSQLGLFISSFAAGLEVGFSVLLMGILYTLLHAHYSSHLMQIWLALAYPIGFIFVIIGKSVLFTEETALAILPVFNKSVSLRSLLKLWGIVYSGNLVGGYLFALMITKVGAAMHIAEPEAFIHLAHKMVDQKGIVILGSAVLAGWLMGLLGWMVTSSQETMGRIVVITLITTVIGIGNLHHCIVGSIEVFSGLLVGSEISVGHYFHFQGWATLGNTIGGVVFVALVKYSHIKADKSSN